MQQTFVSINKDFRTSFGSKQSDCKSFKKHRTGVQKRVSFQWPPPQISLRDTCKRMGAGCFKSTIGMYISTIYIYTVYIYNSYTYDIYNIHIYIYTHIIHPPMVSNFSAQVCFWWLRGSNFRLLEDSGMYPSPIMNHGNHWRRDYVPLVAMELLLLNPAKSAPVEIVITQKKGHG